MSSVTEQYMFMKDINTRPVVWNQINESIQYDPKSIYILIFFYYFIN